MYIDRHICTLTDIYVHWQTYMYIDRHICTLADIYVHWQTYMYIDRENKKLKLCPSKWKIHTDLETTEERWRSINTNNISKNTTIYTKSKMN